MTRIAIAYLDGLRIARALRAGLHELLLDQEHLNKINVFPVPDGDTGTNLALTAGGILAALSAHNERHAGQTLMLVADAALDSSRGNSGAILAQFLQGLADALSDDARVTVRAFVQAMDTAAKYARDAMAQPVEGTVITVVRDVADALGALVNARDFAAVAHCVATAAAQSRDRTPQLLDVLGKANVVDAGAAGFADIAHGVHRFIITGSMRAVPDDLQMVVQPGFRMSAGEVTALSARYCVECMVTGDKIDRRKLREALSALGDSLVVAGTHNKVKIHLHANAPGDVFETAAAYGAISGEKADDMQRQQESSHTQKRGVAVLMDSAGDIPDDLLEELNIHVAPVRLHFGTRSYLDKVSITPDEFYTLLRTSAAHPTTSQPAPGDLRRQYEFLASHFDSVVSLHLGATNSGTWQAALSAAARSSASNRIHVIDTLNASLGQGLIVVHAARCALAGGDAQAVLAAAGEAIVRTRSYAVLRDLSWAVRGGRVPMVVKRMADWLHLTPVLGTATDGKVSLAGVLFGRRRVAQKFVRFVTRRMAADSRYRVAVGYGQSREEGERLLEQFMAVADNVSETWLAQVGTALGVHAGPGILEIAVQAEA